MRLLTPNISQLKGKYIYNRELGSLYVNDDGSLKTSRGVIIAPAESKAIIRDSRTFLDLDEIESHYTRLISLLRRTCNLTIGEACDAVRSHLIIGDAHGGAEAVARIGGASRALQHALSFRSHKR